MANRSKVLEKFSSKYKSKPNREDLAGVSKKSRPDYSRQRKEKQMMWEDPEDDQ